MPKLKLTNKYTKEEKLLLEKLMSLNFGNIKLPNTAVSWIAKIKSLCSDGEWLSIPKFLLILQI